MDYDPNSFYDVWKEIEGKDEEEEEYKEAGFVEHTIFLIDASAVSLEPCTINDKEFAGLTWLEAAVKVVATTMRSKIIAGATDAMAVVFYNTGISKTESAGEEGYYIKQELDTPNVSRIIELEQFSLEDFHENIKSGSNDTRLLYLDTALMYAGSKLPGIATSKASTTGPQFVLVSTRDPTPEQSIANAHSLLTHVGGIASKGGILQLMPLIDPATESFDLEPFWQALLDKAAPQLINQPWESQDSPSATDEYTDDVQRVFSIESLASVVRMRAYRKRAATRMTWKLGPGGPTIGVKLYSTLQNSWPGARGAVQYVHPKDHVPLKPSSALIDQTTATVSPISPAAAKVAAEDPSIAAMYTSTAIPKFYHPKPPSSRDEGKALLPRVIATLEEVKKVKYPMEKGLTLLGFKPLSWLQPWHQLRPATFVYPDEASVKGSSLAFQALLEAIDQANSLAICVLVRGPSSEPRMVAAVPQCEELADIGGQRTQITPPGFHLIYLPFMDDLRSPERDVNFTGGPGAMPTEQQIAAAEEIIKNLDLGEDFDPTAIPNPHLQRHFKVLEAVALQEMPDDEIEDLSLPEEEAFSDLAPHIQAFKDATGLRDADASKGVKRKAAVGAPSADDLAAQAAHVESLEIPKRAAEGTLGLLTIPQLKEYLALHKLPKSGKKDDLVARIEMHLAQQKG